MTKPSCCKTQMEERERGGVAIHKIDWGEVKLHNYLFIQKSNNKKVIACCIADTKIGHTMITKYAALKIFLILHNWENKITNCVADFS